MLFFAMFQGGSFWWTHKVFSKTYVLAHHYFIAYATYVLAASVVSAVLIYSVESSHSEMTWLQAAYLATSASTMTGLTPVNFSRTAWITQVIVLLNIFLCSPILLSLAPLVLRLRSFRRQKRFQQRMNCRRVSYGNQAHRELLQHEMEYFTLTVIRIAVFSYWIVCQVAGWLSLWFALWLRQGSASSVFGSCWPALFLSVSCFQNVGLMPLPEGLPSADQVTYADSFMLLTILLLILAGNICYPIFLRAAIYILHHRFASDPRLLRATDILLRHPRRCYTHLFPAHATCWLCFVAIFLALSQAAAQFACDWEGDLEHMGFERAIGALLFSAIGTRTGGMSILSPALLSPPSCFLTCVCMWVSSSPVVVAIRSTAHQHRKDEGASQASLGSSHLSRDSFDMGGAHLEAPKLEMESMRDQLTDFISSNSGALVFLFFIILLSEWIETQDRNHFMEFMFEFCSAWGTVGLSMSKTSVSVSGQWTGIGQLSLMMVMFLGRLRGLPASIDPSVHVHIDMQDEAQPAQASPRGSAARSIRSSLCSVGLQESVELAISMPIPE